MSDLRNNNITRIFFEYFPMILLFVSVMNDFDFNDVGLKYFSFNFSYILIFYYTLKRKEALGYISLLLQDCLMMSLLVFQWELVVYYFCYCVDLHHI